MTKQSTYAKSVIAVHDFKQKSQKYFKEKTCYDVIQDTWNGVKYLFQSVVTFFFGHPKAVPTQHIPKKYAYVFRKKSLWEMVLLSASVCGIEFCYAAETAFVTPLLLSLGMEMKYVTMIWCMSPFVAFFLTPILGSLSDICSSKIGRRRPFIVALSTCILVGLFLVPYGRQIGLATGDKPINDKSESLKNILLARNDRNASLSDFYSSVSDDEFLKTSVEKAFTKQHLSSTSSKRHVILKRNFDVPNWIFYRSNAIEHTPPKNASENQMLTRSVVFTILGTILIDSCCDICQSPCRAYMLDVSLPKDHTKGLTVFSLMAGLGAGFGYVVGAIEWDVPVFGNLLEGQVIVVFAIISIVFLICLVSSMCVFPEIPLPVLRKSMALKEYEQRYFGENEPCDTELSVVDVEQDASLTSSQVYSTPESSNEKPVDVKTEEECNLPLGTEEVSIKEQLKSIVRMPRSLMLLCLTNLFTWMTSISYCLYFTDFMGEYIFKGDPHASENSPEYLLYKDGVRYGCWGMAICSFFCSFYSMFLGKLIQKFGIKFMYIAGHIVACIGLIVMVVSKNAIAATILSAFVGIIYGTAFTIPYLLVAKYHSSRMEVYALRGMGTDVGAVTSMLVLSQFLISISMGSIAEAIGSNAVTVGAAAVASACAAISAFFVTYPEDARRT